MSHVVRGYQAANLHLMFSLMQNAGFLMIGLIVGDLIWVCTICPVPKIEIYAFIAHLS